MFVYRVRAIPAATAVSVYQVCALSYLLPGGNREDRQAVDSRERRRLILFVYVLGGKYLLYTAGSYTTPNGRETLAQSLNRKG